MAIKTNNSFQNWRVLSMWFDILKVLGTKSGYAQLDFDNIVEEEDDNCKRRWQQMCDKLSKVNIEGFEAKRNKTYSATLFKALREDNPKSNRPYAMIDLVDWGEINYSYGSEIPEEVYCVALNLLGTDFADKDVGEFNVYRIKKENELGAVSHVTIRPKSGNASEYKSGKTVARIGYVSSNRPDIKEMLPRLREKIKTVLPKLKEAFPY